VAEKKEAFEAALKILAVRKEHLGMLEKAARSSTAPPAIHLAAY